MPVALNHMIVGSRDPAAAATWLADVLGLAPPVHSAPFWQVTTANGVDLDFDLHEGPGDPGPAHLAFLVGDQDFDEVFARLVAGGIEHYADPAGRRPGEINHRDGGRGTYFTDPDGHWLEILTRPYGAPA
jgi:catechol 2,3-dioxygenase-like lactoylglutathione lyase family enzyme